MVRGDERQQHRRMPGWVPALALMLSLGCDPPGPPTPAGGDRSTVTPLFVELTDEVGLTFVHEPGAGGRYLMPEPIGAGAVLFDFDQDGDLDIYLVNSGFLDQRGVAVVDPPHGGDRPVNRLFEQDDDGRFVDVTAASGLGHDGYGMGAAAGDVNNDGFPDLYVTNYGSDRLFLNAGDGSFRDITSESGIDNLLWGTSVSFLDFDRDGWLDVFVTNYVDYLPSTRCTDNRGRDDYCGPQLFAGMPDKLYRNTTGDRAGTVRPSAVRFVDVSLTAGIARQGGPGLGVVCADFNDDRWPDIYVANDHAANFLWINRTDGTFAEEAIFRGGALSAQGRPQASMGVGLGDVDANGRLDLFLTHLEGETNALYLGLDDQGFSEAAGRCGLGQPSYPFTGFGTALVDIDHDGDLDVLVANGRVKRTTRPWGGPAANAVPHRSLPASWKNYAEPNLVFLNDGRARFTHYHSPADPWTSTVEISRGLATGDIDNDGDIDLLVANIAGPARLYRNDAPKTGHWLIVRAVEPEYGGRDACGAVVEVHAAGRRFIRVIQPGSSYLSSSDPRAHFGLGTADRVDAIDVTWADGSRETFAGGRIDRLVVVEHGRGGSR